MTPVEEFRHAAGRLRDMIAEASKRRDGVHQLRHPGFVLFIDPAFVRLVAAFLDDVADFCDLNKRQPRADVEAALSHEIAIARAINAGRVLETGGQ